MTEKNIKNSTLCFSTDISATGDFYEVQVYPQVMGIKINLNYLIILSVSIVRD
jgi:hypothetical protein